MTLPTSTLVWGRGIYTAQVWNTNQREGGPNRIYQRREEIQISRANSTPLNASLPPTYAFCCPINLYLPHYLPLTCRSLSLKLHQSLRIVTLPRRMMMSPRRRKAEQVGPLHIIVRSKGHLT